MLEKVKRNVFILLAISILFYIIISIFNDFDSVLESIKNFKWYIFAALLFASCLIFLTRFLKWDYYLNLLEIRISKKSSFAVFMSSLVMLATPGALGELFKSYFLKKITGEPISKTAPIIFAERITDLISITLIALIGSFFFDFGKIAMIFLVLFFILLIIFISNKNISLKFLSILSRIKFLKKYLSKITVAYESFHLMLKGKPLFYMLIISTVSWIIECFSFYVVLSNLEINMSFFPAVFIYALGMIMGSITMLPAGVGVTDGSIIFLLAEEGFSKNSAIAAAFIIRVVTLWFAVALGAFSIFYYNKLLNNFDLET